MDIVIPLGSGSKWNNNELRYALRSIQANLTGYDHIFIIGEDPGFLDPRQVTIIPFKDASKYNHEKNIFDKIVCACKEASVSENFLFTNDDIFFLQKQSVVDYPYYYKGDLKPAYEKFPPGHTYRTSLKNTFLSLFEKKLPTKHFDVHYPIVYNKKSFLEKVSAFDWTKPYGFVIKSLYCNANNIEGVRIKDCKIDRKTTFTELQEIIKEKPCFSIGDRALGPELEILLKERFQVPFISEI